MKTVPIKITVPEAVAKFIRATAKSQKRTVSALIELWAEEKSKTKS